MEKLRSYNHQLTIAGAVLATTNVVTAPPAYAYEMSAPHSPVSAEVQPGYSERGKIASHLASQIAVARLMHEASATQPTQVEKQPTTVGVTDFWFGTKANYKQLLAYAKDGHPFVINNAKTFYVMAKQAALTDTEVGCGDNIIMPESDFDHTLQNTRGSSAFGIGQALPGSKMAKFGPDWRHNVQTQIKWFLKYTGASAKDKIKGAFISICAAWDSRKNKGTY